MTTTNNLSAIRSSNRWSHTLTRCLPFVICAALLMTPLVAAEPAGDKQPVFLLCPHTKGYSAWSVYFVVDKADPMKVLGIGLDKMIGKNSEDLAPSGYEKVLAAQKEASTRTENVGWLDAKSFNGGMLEVKKDDALKLSVKSAGEGYDLMLSMRISADDRFTIGGKETGKRDVQIRFDKDKKAWYACATNLKDDEGRQVVSGGCRAITGIAFPVRGTGIYTVVGVMGDGNAVTLLDRTKTSQE